MNYQYPGFGSGQGYQLGNNFSIWGNGGIDQTGSGLGTAGGLGDGAAGAGAGGGFLGGMSGIDMTRAGLGLANTAFNVWGGIQANKLAREQFRFTKDVTNTNLNNSIQTYNTSLEDRIRARSAQEGTSAADAQAYIDRNRLSRGG